MVACHNTHGQGDTDEVSIKRDAQKFESIYGEREAVLMPGMSMGDLALQDGIPIEHTIVASEKTQFLCIPRPVHLRVLKLMKKNDFGKHDLWALWMKSTTVFSSWTKLSLLRLASFVEEKTFVRGEEIVTQGKFSSGVMLIFSGECEASQNVHLYPLSLDRKRVVQAQAQASRAKWLKEQARKQGIPVSTLKARCTSSQSMLHDDSGSAASFESLHQVQSQELDRDYVQVNSDYYYKLHRLSHALYSISDMIVPEQANASICSNTRGPELTSATFAAETFHPSSFTTYSPVEAFATSTDHIQNESDVHEMTSVNGVDTVLQCPSSVACDSVSYPSMLNPCDIVPSRSVPSAPMPSSPASVVSMAKPQEPRVEFNQELLNDHLRGLTASLTSASPSAHQGGAASSRILLKVDVCKLSSGTVIGGDIIMKSPSPVTIRVTSDKMVSVS